MRTVEQILDIVCEFLKQEQHKLCYRWRFAVLFYGNPRTTMDIDYVIQLADENIPELIQFLQQNGFHATSMICALHSKRGHTVRLKIKKLCSGWISKEYTAKWMNGRFENKRMVKQDGTSVWIASPEDTIVNKLVCARENRILRTLSDICKQYDSLDKEIWRDCKKIGVYDELRE